MSAVTLSSAPSELDDLREEVRKLRKINSVLMDRVERSTDMQGSAFSMFETAISLEQLVRERTHALEDAMAKLATVNVQLAEAHANADAARMRLREAIESIQEGFALFDAEDRLVLCNKAYISFWPEVAEVIHNRPTFHDIARLIAMRQRPIGALVAPDRWVTDRLARHNIAEGIHVQALSDGRWLQINELRTSEGGIVGIYTDITEVKAQDALQRTLELASQNLALQSILDNLSEGVCMFDADKKLTAWNGSLQRLLGVTGDAKPHIATHGDLLHYCRNTLGMEPLDVLGWRDEDTAEPHIRLCSVGDSKWEVRTTTQAKGGMVLVFIDVTEALHAREVLQSTADVLERLVAERTSELMHVNRRLEAEIAEKSAIEAQLLEAKTVAEKANLSKTSFIAAASHDLLQPLNAARLFIGSLGERRHGAHNRTLIDQTSTALDSVDDLLEALLEISRLDAGAVTPERTHFNLDWLMDPLRTEFLPVAQSNGLNLRVTNRGDWVYSDVRLLRRILQNLVSNAIRYTRKGSVELSTTVVGGEVKITVTDTGPGIAPEHREAIFEEFRRLDVNRATPGMGLGLAIVKRAAEKLGSPLDLVSNLGEGSSFSVTVPLGEPMSKEIPDTSVSRGNSIRARRVLAIDNEPQIQVGMQTLLTGWGCEVATAVDASTALEHLNNGFVPDVILADYHLDDGLTGEQAIRSIFDHLGCEIPAIIITADRSDELKTHLKQQNLAVLRKPVKPAQLRALLHTLNG